MYQGGCEAYKSLFTNSPVQIQSTHYWLCIEPELFHVTLIKELVGDSFGKFVLDLPRLGDRADVTGRHQHATQNWNFVKTNYFYFYFFLFGILVSVSWPALFSCQPFLSIYRPIYRITAHATIPVRVSNCCYPFFDPYEKYTNSLLSGGSNPWHLNYYPSALPLASKNICFTFEKNVIKQGIVAWREFTTKSSWVRNSWM